MTKFTCAVPWSVPRLPFSRAVRPPGGPAPNGDESVASFILRHFGRGMLDNITEPLLAGVYGLINAAWLRVTRVQAEVHGKLLDRFASNEDLLAYIQTPAGRKFLESAPIPLDTPRSISAPLGRILWSVQAGAVLAVGGIGLMIVAKNTVDEVREPLGALGVVAIALGIGFLISAVMAYMISQRLGLFHPATTASTPETHV